MATPFLKWAGGKAKLAQAVLDRFPRDFGAYHEPFLGGGAVFFRFGDVHPGSQARINDQNETLAETYRVLRDQTDTLLDRLRSLSDHYLGEDAAGRAAFYYAVRASEPADPAGRAARLIFLNRTCYNGLHRINRSGRFNVPHGRYLRPRILDEDNLRACAAALASADVSSLDFGAACTAAAPGDAVYLDPPYFPLSTTSRFTAYTANGFGWPEQERLAAVFRDLTRRGVFALLSNSAHPAISALYESFEVEEVPMSRAINSRGDRRDSIPELLVSNANVLAGQLPNPS
ncbi:MAG: Dam family site-specific DNA-(adenine-N6)-methyltransferase [Dehalococcoidia bacterium]